MLLFYSKSEHFRFNVLRTELDESYVEKVYTRVDENGRRYRLDNISAPRGAGPIYEWGGITQPWRFTKEKMEKLYAEGRIRKYPDGRAMINAYVRYLDESVGQPVQDWWDDIGVIAAPAKERLGYPTQKPLALLERIIEASSNPGDIVLDPFCGGLGNAAYKTGGIRIADITQVDNVLAELRAGVNVALMCVCSDATTCHRSVIVAEIVGREPSLLVDPLGGRDAATLDP